MTAAREALATLKPQAGLAQPQVSQPDKMEVTPTPAAGGPTLEATGMTQVRTNILIVLFKLDFFVLKDVKCKEMCKNILHLLTLLFYSVCLNKISLHFAFKILHKEIEF